MLCSLSTSTEALLLKRLLRCSHYAVLKRVRIAKQFLFGEMAEEKRTADNPKLGQNDCIDKTVRNNLTLQNYLKSIHPEGNGKRNFEQNHVVQENLKKNISKNLAANFPEKKCHRIGSDVKINVATSAYVDHSLKMFKEVTCRKNIYFITRYFYLQTLLKRMYLSW